MSANQRRYFCLSVPVKPIEAPARTNGTRRCGGTKVSPRRDAEMA